MERGRLWCQLTRVRAMQASRLERTSDAESNTRAASQDPRGASSEFTERYASLATALPAAAHPCVATCAHSLRSCATPSCMRA